MATQYSVSLGLQVQQALQSLKSLTAQFIKFDKEVDEATAELNKFEKELKDQSGQVKNTISAQTAYIAKLEKMASTLDRSSKKFRIVNAELTKFKFKVEGSIGGVNQLATALAGLGVGFTAQRLVATLDEVGSAITGAEGAVRTLAGDAFDEYQASIAAVVKESDGLTNAIEAQQASYQLLSAGVSGAADVSQVLADAVKRCSAII